MGDRSGTEGTVARDKPKFLPQISFQMFENMVEHITKQGHDGKVIFDKSNFNVQTDIFVDVANGVVGFSAKDRCNFKDAFKDADHDLLIELWALRQIGRPAKVIDGEQVGSTLRG